jgi:AmiR/NasT family two-component response regulator
MTGTIDHQDLHQLAETLDQLTQAQEKIAHLEAALASNRRIGMALGIIMATHRVTEEQAFERLAAQSRREQRKLRDVAETVVLTGTT